MEGAFVTVLSAMGRKELGHFTALRFFRLIERRAAHIVFGVDVGAVLEKHPRHFDVAFTGNQVKSGPALLEIVREVKALLEQRRKGVEVAMLDGIPDRVVIDFHASARVQREPAPASARQDQDPSFHGRISGRGQG